MNLFLFWFSHTKNDSNQPNRFLIDVRFEQVNSINANRTDNWQFRHKTISCILQQTDGKIVPDGRSLRILKSPRSDVSIKLLIISLTIQLKTDYHRKDDGTGTVGSRYQPSNFKVDTETIVIVPSDNESRGPTFVRLFVWTLKLLLLPIDERWSHISRLYMHGPSTASFVHVG